MYNSYLTPNNTRTRTNTAGNKINHTLLQEHIKDTPSLTSPHLTSHNESIWIGRSVRIRTKYSQGANNHKGSPKRRDKLYPDKRLGNSKWVAEKQTNQRMNGVSSPALQLRCDLSDATVSRLNDKWISQWVWGLGHREEEKRDHVLLANDGGWSDRMKWGRDTCTGEPIGWIL